MSEHQWQQFATVMRPAQWRAILGGGLLLLLLSGERLVGGSQTALPAVSAGPAKLSPAELRGRLVGELQQRNPRLGALRSGRIADAVLRCTERQKLAELTPQLVVAVMLQESNARPGVTSAKGAIGLMQVMPYVYYDLLDLPGSIGHLESNVEAGCMVLADNIRRLGRRQGISSYFWGNAIVSDTYVKGVESILRELDRGPLRAESNG